MGATKLAVIGAVCLALAVYTLYIYVPGGSHNPLAYGETGDGEVLTKQLDAQPDGTATHLISYTFEDRKGVNHLASRAMRDAGLWGRLEEHKNIKVYYLPADPDTNLIAGEVVPSPPAITFVGYSALIAGLALSLMAFSAWMQASNAKLPPTPDTRGQR